MNDDLILQAALLLCFVATAVVAFCSGYTAGRRSKYVPPEYRWPEPPHGSSVGFGTANAVDLAKQHTHPADNDHFVYGKVYVPNPYPKHKP